MDATTNLETPADAIAIEKPVEEAPRRLEFDWEAISKSPAFFPGLALAAALGALFWGLFRDLPGLWFSDDGYYSHGILVPLISFYVLYRWWPSLRRIPVQPSYLAIVPLLAILFVSRATVAYYVHPVSSVALIITLLFGVAFVAGWRWMLAVMLPTCYLLFALPIWNMAISYYTNPLQTLSTKVAFWILQVTGFNPNMDSSTIYLDKFNMEVGVPCSGLKLVLALYAFTIFFAMIANLKTWANAVLILLVPLPLALFINGLRIALIGIVGENYGNEAGHRFHDYSGYITLGVCFFILFKVFRWLGWKD
jgi:exosortase